MFDMGELYMKCEVCGNNISDNSAKCNVCGFPVLKVPFQEMNGEIRKQIEQMAVDYRNELLKDIELLLVVYFQNTNGKARVLNKEEMISLTNCLELCEDSIIWCDKEFANVDTEDLEIHVVLRRNDKKDEILIFKVMVPEGDGLWRVGVKKVGFMGVQLVIANDIDSKNSQVISLTDVITF